MIAGVPNWLMITIAVLILLLLVGIRVHVN